MKTLTVLSILFSCLLLATPALSIDTDDYTPVTLPELKDASPHPTVYPCPVSRFIDNDKCMSCHKMILGYDGKPEFGLKPVHISENYDLPFGTSILVDEKGMALYWNNEGTYAAKVRTISFFLYENPEFNRLVMEMHSPGGSVMDAWRAVGIIQEMQARGIIVETRTYGISASASVILMVAGNIGHRYITPHAEVMLHKVWTFAMFDFKTPDTAEDQAQTLKHFQTNINMWILSRTKNKFPKDELEAGIFKRDFWMTGAEAVEFGLADNFVR